MKPNPLLFTLVVCGLLFFPALAAVLTACTSGANCPSNSYYCSTDANVCVYKHFVDVTQHYISLNLSSVTVVMINVTDPVGREGEYKLTITPSSSGKYYAKFYGKTSDVTIHLDINETKQIPLQFTGAAIGSYEVVVQAYDTSYSTTSDCEGGVWRGINNCIDTNVCKFIVFVSGDKRTSLFTTAPGPDGTALILLGILTGCLYGLKSKGEKNG